MNMDKQMQYYLIMFISGLVVLLLIILVIRAIWRAIKRFTFEAIDRANGVGKPNYRDEARRACGKAEPKQDKNATPPWEE